MAEVINGLDISIYQGPVTDEIVDKLVANNIKFVQVRFSQGSGYRDKQAVNSVKKLVPKGISVGGYHFTTNDNAIAQFTNFTGAMEEVKDLLTLIPWMDCEAYAAFGGRYLDLPPMLEVKEDASLTPIKQLYVDHLIASEANPLKLAFYKAMPKGLYSYDYPSSAVVDSLGMRLKDWMANFPAFSYSVWPSIYTNASSGNHIFGSNTAFKKYPLTVANWTTAPIPYMPTAWAGEAYYMWQNAVISAAPYGFDSLKVDHDLYGEKYPFPGSVTPPPPPPPPQEEWFDVVATHHPSGVVFIGRMDPEA